MVFMKQSEYATKEQTYYPELFNGEHFVDNALNAKYASIIKGLDEYKKTKERYDFMSEQRLDLENTAAKLRKVIQEMTSTMKDQFAEKFAIINKNFNPIHFIFFYV